MLNALRDDHQLFITSGSNCRDNLALRLEKLNYLIDEPNEKDHQAKDSALQVMTSFKVSETSNQAYQYFFTNWKKAFENSETEVFEIQASTKVLLGTGNASVFEFGFNLMKPWGTPYISGSSLKGLVSSFLANNGGDDWWRSPNNQEKSDLQVELFGGFKDKKSFIGSVNFNDAWLCPNPGPWFQEDIINVHHQSYYSGKSLPDGTESPVPVKIAALKPSLKFLVVLQGPEKERKFIKDVLLQALRIDGIGGKTAVGYGRFEYVKGEEDKYDDIIDADNETLIKFSKQSSKTKENFYPAWKEALNSRPLATELKNVYKKFVPLKYLRLALEKGEISSFKELNNKDNKRAIKGHSVLSSDADAQFIFSYALKNFKEEIDAVNIEETILKDMAYQWRDMNLNEDKVVKILDDKNHQWPPKDSLEEYLLSVPELEGLAEYF